MNTEDRIAQLELALTRLRDQTTSSKGAEPTTPSGPSIVNYLEAAEARTREPWRGIRDVHRAGVKQLFSNADQNRRAIVTLAVDLAKAGELSIEDAMSIQYVVFGSPEDHLFFSHILLRMSGVDRIHAHNWYVAEMLGPVFIDTYGEILSRLEFPLFPNKEEFSGLNTRLLKWASEAPTGGGAKKAIPPMFKNSTPKITGGEYWAPVLSTATGPAANLTEIESAFSTLTQRVTSLEHQTSARSNKQQGYRGRGGRGGTFRGGGQGSPQFNNQLPQQQPQRDDPPRGRGGKIRGGEGPLPLQQTSLRNF